MLSFVLSSIAALYGRATGVKFPVLRFVLLLVGTSGTHRAPVVGEMLASVLNSFCTETDTAGTSLRACHCIVCRTQFNNSIVNSHICILIR